MNNVMKEQIIDLFIDPQETMEDGLWMSGYEGEGEYKEWWESGQLYSQCFNKNGKKDGEFKSWYENDIQNAYCFYKNGVKEGEFKSWYDNGQLNIHCF